MTVIILLFLAAFIPAAIAHRKGERAALWWILGFFLFPIALIAAISLPTDRAALIARQIRDSGMRRCPHCAEAILPAAKVCRYCGRDV